LDTELLHSRSALLWMLPSLLITIFFFDDKAVASNLPSSYPFASFRSPEFADYTFFVCLGYRNLKTRMEIIHVLKGMQRKVPSVIHSTVYRANDAQVEDGAFVFPGCLLDKQTIIGAGSILHNGVIVSHNTAIGQCCYLSPRVTLAGNVSVGNNTFLGVGTIVSNNISIGSECVVGAGSVVTKDLSDKKHAIGNPLIVKDQGLNLI
jgi:sugar O-acyltransferase (sialic acid O-acetyltransferase NeuD family)